jgi:LysR family transcriptional regulator, hydrogen peroxide-inducible genes activator
LSLAGLSLRDLEYLVAVAECRHFGRAAKQCRVSQPALSAQVRKLEGYLGARIFERSRNGVLVTRPGAALVERARLVLTEANTLLAVARDSAAPLAGPFRLGSIPTVGPYFLPHLLTTFRRAFPNTWLVLSEKRTNELMQLLRSGELDAVIACAPVHDPLLTVHKLFFEPFVLAHPPGRLPAWPPTPAAPDQLVLLEEGHCLRDQTLAACGPVLPRAKRHATGLEMLRHMVAAGEGLSLMPALAAAALGPIDGLVTYTPIAAEYAGRHVIMLVRASDPRNPHLAQVAQLARQCVPPPAVAARADGKRPDR